MSFAERAEAIAERIRAEARDVDSAYPGAAGLLFDAADQVTDLGLAADARVRELRSVARVT